MFTAPIILSLSGLSLSERFFGFIGRYSRVYKQSGLSVGNICAISCAPAEQAANLKSHALIILYYADNCK